VKFWILEHWLSSFRTPKNGFFTGASGICALENGWLLPSVGGGGGFCAQERGWGNCTGRGWGEVRRRD